MVNKLIILGQENRYVWRRSWAAVGPLATPARAETEAQSFRSHGGTGDRSAAIISKQKQVPAFRRLHDETWKLQDESAIDLRAQHEGNFT
jgi:hypothetical protein